MGRPRSKYICPKCNNQGYKEHSASRNGNYKNSEYRKYWRVVHYDSSTKKKKFCYIDRIFYVMEIEELLLDYKKRLEQMSVVEIQEEYLAIQREDKERRIRTKEIRQVLKEVVELQNKIKSDDG